MIKYSRYLFLNILSKKSFWITLLASLAVITTMGILRISDENSSGRSVVTTLTTFNKFLPFIFTTLISCLLVLYIFKYGEQDGSELMIAAKPIERHQIVAGKFFVLIAMLVSVELVLFLDVFAYVQKDTIGLFSEKLKYAASLAIGGLIIQLIISSLLALLALFASRVVLLSIGIVSAAIIPISSMVISPISSGTPLFKFPKINRDIHNKVIVQQPMNYMVDKLEDVYGKMDLTLHHTVEEYQKIDDGIGYTNKRTTLDKSFINVGKSKKDIEDADKYRKSIWYQKVAPFDMWFQWSGFYDIVMGENYVDTNKIQKWESEKEIVNYDQKFSLGSDIKLDGRNDDIINKMKNTFVVFKQSTISKIESEKIINYVNSVLTGKRTTVTPVSGKPDANTPLLDLFTKDTIDTRVLKNKIPGQHTKIDMTNSTVKTVGISLEERIKSVAMYFDSKDNWISYPGYIAYKMIVNELKKQNKYVYPKWITRDNREHNNPGPLKASDREFDSFIIQNGDEIQKWVPKPFVHRSTKVYIWTALATVMLALTILVYSKRDFK